MGLIRERNEMTRQANGSGPESWSDPADEFDLSRGTPGTFADLERAAAMHR